MGWGLHLCTKEVDDVDSQVGYISGRSHYAKITILPQECPFFFFFLNHPFICDIVSLAGGEAAAH